MYSNDNVLVVLQLEKMVFDECKGKEHVSLRKYDKYSVRCYI